MKKFFVFLCAMFVLSAHATTVNIDWLMDGATYAQTTCETGGNFSLPTPTPTKYGYHFVGWQQNDAIGSWAQSGTPTPDNPIYPTFGQFGNTVLRALGSGDNFVADSYNPTTGKITRRVGVKVLDGTEDWLVGVLSNGLIRVYSTGLLPLLPTDDIGLVSHFPLSSVGNRAVGRNPNTAQLGNISTSLSYLGFKIYQSDFANATAFSQFLADQYTAGTPVTVYYPLATPVEENYNAQ